MAVVVGESGAWIGVRKAFQEKRLEVLVPDDLTSLLHSLRQRQEQGEGPLRAAFDKKLAEDEALISAMCADLPLEIARRTGSLLEEALQIERTLQAYRTSSWLKRILFLRLPTRRLRTRKNQIYANKERIAAFLQHELATRQQQHERRIQSRPQVVADRFQEFFHQAEFVEKMLHSADFIGAQAELEVLALLKNLPDCYLILCDHKTRARRKIRFAGEYLQSAQIDFLVIGPSGVFVLEVKRWSRQFIAQNQYFDPYEQVGRSSYLCYDLLRSYGNETKVYSTIVNCGVIPAPKGEDYRVQVVTPPNLVKHLTSRRGRILDTQALDQIAATFKQFSR